MVDWTHAAFWGFVAGSGLALGGLVGAFVRLSHRVIATTMAFGGGVLVFLLSLDLLVEAYDRAGFGATALGFLGGAAVFSTVNAYLAQKGARHRKRCGRCVAQPSESEHPGSGLAIASGLLIDGVPESIAVGVMLLEGEPIGVAVVIGFFLGNIPEAVSSTAGMLEADRSRAYVFGTWAAGLTVSTLGAIVGLTAFDDVSATVFGATTAFAGGGVLSMLAETMIPEAFEEARRYVGLVTVAGFTAAFAVRAMVT